MRVGQFFSLKRGQVGQYLSPRVLVVRKPFQPSNTPVCYFGFDRLSQAQKFAHYLATMGYTFQLRRSEQMPQNYEIRLQGQADLAKTLAYWDRVDNRQILKSQAQSITASPQTSRRAPVELAPAA